MIISDDIINQIKERINIVEVIGEYVNLKAAGKNYKGLCPFHSEKTPSFTVSSEKGIFHCFGCGTGGNVFTFLMKMKGVSFPDAVQILGKRSGIQIRRSNFETTGQSKYDALYKINKSATEIFERNLFTDKGKKALAYLKGRNFDLNTIKSFHLGYAEESWDSLFKLLRSKGFSTDLIEESGLIVKNKTGTGYYDRFRNRIIFPIQDNIERVIGFGGRTLDKTNPEIPKYINTNENILFHKGKYLFGFHNAVDFVRKSGFVFLVEGYLDVIRMHKEGIKNTVAPLGTALTEEQVSFLIRYTRKVYLVFDPDEAGRKAMMRSIALFHMQGLDPAVVLLPSGKDPGNFFDEYSAEDFGMLVDGAESGIDYIVKYYIEPKKEYTANEKITILQTLSEYYKNMNDEILMVEFIKKLSSVLRIAENIIERELSRFVHRATLSPYRLENDKKTPIKEKKDKWIRKEQYLLLLLLSNPQLLPVAVRRLDKSDFHGKWTRKLWEALLYTSKNEHWDSGAVFDYLDDEKYIEYLSGKLMEEELMINPENQLIDVVASLKEKRIRDYISDINERLMKAELENNESLTNELIIEKQTYKHELEKMKILRGSKTWS